ncbi:MAG: methyltransferase [Actinobacteria bacterium]|nr:methyltransferase [Actinomycetota bacterium]
MRIVAGSARGRRLVAPPGDRVRPTGDRVRESVFNALGSLGVLSGAVVVDLFAGSGALGLEARSRGASEVHLVERNRDAVAAIRRNIEVTGLSSGVNVIPTSVSVALAEDGPLASVDASIVLADPPYAHRDWDGLLINVLGRWSGAILVAESDRELDAAALDVATLDDRHVEVRRYGTTVVTFVHPG